VSGVEFVLLLNMKRLVILK